MNTNKKLLSFLIVISLLTCFIIKSNADENVIITKQNIKGMPVVIKIKKGINYSDEKIFGTITPQQAFWVEDMDGNYIDTIYVTKNLQNKAGRLPIRTRIKHSEHLRFLTG